MVSDAVITQLAIVGCVHAMSVITFGAFELGVPAWKRLLKFAVIAGLMAALAAWFGVATATIVYLTINVLGISFHIWWCTRNGIEILRPEPRDRYFELRGWQTK